MLRCLDFFLRQWVAIECIILHRMIVLEKSFWHTSVSTGVLGQIGSSFQRGWVATARNPCMMRWQSVQGHGEKWIALRELVRRREVGIQFYSICLLWGTWLIILPLTKRGTVQDRSGALQGLCCLASPANGFGWIWLRGDSWPGTKLYFRC